VKEDGWRNFELDVELPEKYQCNGFTRSHFTAQLQESEDRVGQIFSTEKQKTCKIRWDLGCKKCSSIVTCFAKGNTVNVS